MICPACGATLPATAVSEALGAGRCPSCRALFDLQTRTTVKGATRRPETLATPERWLVEASPSALKIRWRWFSLALLFLVPFTLFWNGILIAMAGGVTEGGAHPERLLIGLAVPHVWIGVGLAYYCLAILVNVTNVEVAGGALKIHHGPLPWRGNRSFQTGEVQQLFVVEKRGNRGAVTYELCALLRDGTRRALISGLSDQASARFLEVRLEQAMNIVDQPVSGEVSH